MSVVTRRAVLGMLAALPVLSFAAAPLRLTVVNLMPWAGLTPQGQPTGVLVDLAAQLTKLSAIPIHPMLVPYGRAPYMLSARGADLIIAVDLTAPIGAHVTSFGPVEIVIFGRTGFRYQNLRELEGKTVGHLRHALYSAELKQQDNIRKHPFDTYEQAVRMLHAGRLDAICGVGPSIEFALQALNAQDVSERFLLTRGRVVLQADPAIDATALAALQIAGKQLEQQHTMEKLLQQYLSAAKTAVPDR